MWASPLAPRAIQVLLRALDPAHSRDLRKALAQDPEWRRDLITAYGVSGNPSFVPWLISQMGEEPGLARIAGESFSLIAGAGLAYEDLERVWPDGFEAGPSERSEDEDIAMDPDEDLPWPDPARVNAWWAAYQGRFQAGTRYLAGAPVGETHCRRVLQAGMQRQRHAAAPELALMHPVAALF